MQIKPNSNGVNYYYVYAENFNILSLKGILIS